MKTESFNTEASIMNLDGVIVPAKSALCLALPTVVFGLEALKLLSKNFIVKLCIGVVITAIKTFKAALCPQQPGNIDNEK
jgi:hypothetical protein